jgi:hypothetical protein
MSTMAHKYMNVVSVKKNGFNNLKTNKIMKDKIKKWWNREWSNWEEFDTTDTYIGSKLKGSNLILKRLSSDGLIEFKKIKIF